MKTTNERRLRLVPGTSQSNPPIGTWKAIEEMTDAEVLEYAGQVIIHLSVKASPRGLADNELADRVKEIADKHRSADQAGVS